MAHIKDAYTFLHDANARNDIRLRSLMCAHGLEAYGFFWAVLEIMREQADYRLDVSDKFVPGLAHSLALTPEHFNTLLDAAVEIGLFVRDGSKVFSESFLRRMSAFDDKRRTLRANASRRESKCSANAEQMLSICIREQEPNLREQEESKSSTEGGPRRKPKRSAAEYSDPDRSGNPRTAEPDFPNIHLSDHERELYARRCDERGLRAEFRRFPFEQLQTSLSRPGNLAKSVEHYSALIGWAMSAALKQQADTDRAARASEVRQAPLPTAKETQDDAIKRIRAYGERSRNHGHAGNHGGDVPVIPANRDGNPTMVPNAEGCASQRNTFSAGPLHQNQSGSARANHQPDFSSAERHQPGEGAEVRRALETISNQAAGVTRAATQADASCTGEIPSPVRRTPSTGAAGRQGGNSDAFRRNQP